MSPSPIIIPPLLTASRNVVVKQALVALQKYNLMLPTMLNQKRTNKFFMVDSTVISNMDAAYFGFVAYILHKSPAIRKERGQEKWRAAVEICKQLDEHATYFGIRFLQGDFSTKVGHNYWLERYNPNEVHMQAVEDFAEWMQKSTDKLPFTPARTTFVMQYMDEISRQGYEVTFANGLALRNEKPVDTLSNTATGAYSGFKNTWIYVCSAKTRKIYTGPCKEGSVHHSSFLGGEPVVCAGDWYVTDGQVAYVNTGSGHYRPTSYNMEVFAKMFENVWIPETMVQPTFKGKVMFMKEYLRKGMDAKPIPDGRLKELAEGLEVTVDELTKHTA